MKKIQIKFWLICLIGICYFSCNNDDGDVLFSDSPAERIAERNSELLGLLTSEDQGYKAVYFTKNDEFGGFTYYMKFDRNGTVAMTSDFDTETAIESSSYEVRLGTTNELVFTTRNHIQKVSNPSFSGLVGTGFKGTSVFQYFSNDNGVLTFKDVRNSESGFLVLTPTGFSDFDTESVLKAEASLAQRQNILPSVTTSVFQLLSIQNSNGVSNFNFNYDSVRLFASPRIVSDNGEVTELNFGLSFTEDGLSISPALEFQGETYQNFIYDTETASYISQVNGTSATILFSNEPAFFKDDVNALGDSGRRTFISFLVDGTSPLTSLGFIALLEELEVGVRQVEGFSNWSYAGIAYYAEPDADGNVRLDIFFENPDNSNLEQAIFLFNAGVSDNRLFLNFTGLTNQTGIDLFDPLIPMLQFFASPNGMYFSDEGSFVTDTSAFGNSASTFTSLSQSNLRVYGLWLN